MENFKLHEDNDEFENGKFTLIQTDLFSISVPDRFEKYELPNSGNLLFVEPRKKDDIFCENISVVCDVLYSPISLQDYTSRSLFYLTQSDHNCKLLLNRTKKLPGGIAAQEVIYTGLEQNHDLIFHQIWLVYHHLAFTITFTCTARLYHNSFNNYGEACLLSFRILNGNLF